MFDLRLSEYFLKKENAQRLVRDINNNPGSADNVWLNSLYGFPPYEKVREAVENMKEVKKIFNDGGITVSLQISNTLGHSAGHMKYYDYSGLVFEGTPVERMVGEYGESSYGCYCPNGEFFRNYIYETTKMYAEIDPVHVWVDDDLRIYNHAPVNHGCFCDDCIARFNKKHGTSYTRETLVYEINHGDVNVRKAYIEQNRTAIYGLASIISKAVHEVAPNARMAYQSSRTNSYLGADFNCFFDAMYEGSGKKPVGYRPGGGYYEDSSPREMLGKALHLDCAISVVPEYVEDICPEIESLPDVVFGKSCEGTAKEAALYLAYGCNSLSFAALNHGTEFDDYNDRLLSYFSKYSGFWNKLIDHNKGASCTGVGIYISPESHLRVLSENDKDFAWDYIRYAFNPDIATIGLPVTNNYKNCPAILLYPAACDFLTENDVKYLITKPVLCDGETIEKLYKMGYGKYFGASVVENTKPSCREYYTDHPVNGNAFGKFWGASMFHKGYDKKCHNILDKDGKTEVLGNYIDIFTKENYGAVSAVVNTYGDDGKALVKWAVIGYSLWPTILSSLKRDQIINAVDYISGNKLAGKLLCAEQAVLILRSDKNGKTASVSVQSVSIGESEKIKLLVRNPRGEKFSYMSGRKQLTEVPFEKTDDGYVVELPTLEPYEMITVFCG